MRLSDYTNNKKIAILGYGLEGKSTYRFLRVQGVASKNITILDKNEQIDLPEESLGQLGTSYLDHLEQFDWIWKTPGITTTLIEQTTKMSVAHLPFISQTQYFLENYSGTIIGVTGTKGKSTISTLTYLTLQHAGKHVLLAGNIGKPVLDLIDRDNLPDIVVYELSSFMIESVFTNRTGRKIDIAICNTLYNTHTKEHGGYENYIHAKLLLLKHSKKSLIGYQAKELITTQFPQINLPKNTSIYGKQGTWIWKNGYFWKNQERLFTDEGMLLVGTHNRENTCAVIALCMLLEVNFYHLQEVLHSFGGLEHRLEYVGTYKNILRYNDAIATTPQATCAALDSFGEKVDTLFYGGILGEYDHQLVADKIRDYNIRHLVLFPDTGEVLFSLLDAETQKRVSVKHTRSLHEGVQRAAEIARSGSIALLSCGSPSFSVRSGFVEKGNLFKEEVKKII